MKEKQVLNKGTWTELSKEWAVGIPPMRPSYMEISLYEDCLQKIIHKKGRKVRALLLGATPELRDLLAKYEVETTIVDINPNMIRAMEDLLEYSKGKETVITADWLKIPLESDSFDISILDHGLHHIYFEKWEDFFEENRRLLKRGGHFLHAYVTGEKNEIATAAQAVSAYKNSIFTREDRYYYCYRIWMGVEDVEEKKYYKNCKHINDAYYELLQKGEIEEKDYEYLRLPEPIASFKAVMAPKEIVDELFGRYMTIKSIKTSFVHPVFTYHKLYFGEVKK